MDNNVNMRVITLKELWDLFLKKLLLLILAAALAGGGLLAFNILTYKPEYSSTATLYILRQDENNSSGDAANDFSLALKVVNDCTYMLKSHAILDEVIDSLGLAITYKDLYDRVSTSNPDNTRILEVTVKADSPEQAKKIVDTLCTIGPDKIDEAMGYEQVNLFEYGILDKKPSNGYGITKCVLLGIVVAMLTYAIFLVVYLLDDRIHSDDDLAKNLGLSILGDIPNADATHKEGYGRYGYRYGYGYGTQKKKKGVR